jgi:Domain of unknown function (DUF4397)
MFHFRALAVAALTLAGTTLVANPLASAQQPSEMAMVRVVHASPDAPAVDIWLDGQPAIRGLAFGQYTGHTAVPAGNRHVQVTPAGGQPDSAVIDANVELSARQAYTVMATGPLTEIKPLVLQDERTAGRDSRARFVHASPGAPAVDIAVAGGPVVISNVAFGADSGYVDVPAGDVPLEVRVAGTEQVVLTVPATFTQGYVYTLAAVGLAGGEPPLQALALNDTSQVD